MNSSEKTDEERAKELEKKAERDPEEAKSKIDGMVELLKSNEKKARVKATFALGNIAEEYPGEVKPYTDEIAKLLNESNDYARTDATFALGNIAEEYPGEVKPYTDEIAKLLNDVYALARERAAEALGNIAEEYPGRVESYEDDLKDLDKNVRKSAEETIQIIKTQKEESVVNYLRSHGGEIDLEEAAEELGYSEGEIEAALNRLQEKGKIEPE